MVLKKYCKRIEVRWVEEGGGFVMRFRVRFLEMKIMGVGLLRMDGKYIVSNLFMWCCIWFLFFYVFVYCLVDI